MLLTRAATPPSGAQWSFEVKYDGWRAIVEVRRNALRVWTRNGRDISARFAELQPLRRLLPACVLDCELVVLDDHGRPRFDWMHRKHRPDATLIAFDVLRARGRAVLGRALEERRAILSDIVPNDLPLLLRSRTFSDGDALLAACESQQLEGIVAKRLGSAYTPGARTNDWVKVRTAHGQALIQERIPR
jgi:bifunctional non-homologous end joining protein LigD